jgi:hypothetical protein
MLSSEADGRIVVGGMPNLTRYGAEFATAVKPVLEALEEQVALLKLLGEATSPDAVTVRIGQENPYKELQTSSVVAAGYGSAVDMLATIGVVGPTGWTTLDHGIGPGGGALCWRFCLKDDKRHDEFGLLRDPRRLARRDTGADEGLSPAGGELHPDVASEPGAATASRSPRRTGAQDPKKRIYDRGGDPLGGGMGGFSSGFTSAGFDFTNLMDAMFGGGQASRDPRSRCAAVRMRWSARPGAGRGRVRHLKPLRVDTAVLCPRCNRSGASEGSGPTRCGTCHGQGDVTHIQRSFIGDIRTTQPCPTCRGFGTVISTRASSAPVTGRCVPPAPSMSRSGRGEHRQPDPLGRAR